MPINDYYHGNNDNYTTLDEYYDGIVVFEKLIGDIIIRLYTPFDRSQWLFGFNRYRDPYIYWTFCLGPLEIVRTKK
jgi:hypothetical protein